MGKKAVKITLRMAGGVGSVIPKGVVENLVIEVVDFGASYKFNSVPTTRAFVLRQVSDGVESVYQERTQKCFCKYPGKLRDEIVEHIKQRLKALSAKTPGKLLEDKKDA